MDIKALIRDIPDFPKPGIIFKDITTLLRDPAGWKYTLDRLAAACEPLRPDYIGVARVHVCGAHGLSAGGRIYSRTQAG
jgi:adenine/guanine phosphoribosyltransferase-like PRPP-binding protein